MATNTTVYPFGTGGSLPSSVGIIDDLTTGGADKALSAKQGKILNDRTFIDYDLNFLNGYILRRDNAYVIDADNAYKVSDYIDVSPYTVVRISTNLHRSSSSANDVCVCSYDSSKTFVANIIDPRELSNSNGTVEVSNFEYSVPSGVKYIRICNKKAGNVTPKMSVLSPEEDNRINKRRVDTVVDKDTIVWLKPNNGNSRRFITFFSVPTSITIEFSSADYDVAVVGVTSANGAGYFNPTNFDTGWKKGFINFVPPQNLAQVQLRFRHKNNSDVSSLDVNSVISKFEVVCTSPLVETQNDPLVTRSAMNVLGYAIKDAALHGGAYIHSINHRGYNVIAPENTIPAFKLSYQNGFRYVETDVAFTSDNVIVLLHDASINRTARNADGTSISSTINIADITYEQALEYDFGIWKGAEYAGTKIPTLKQFCQFCRATGIHPNIELKSEATTTQAAAVVAVVDECGLHGKVTYISGNSTLLAAIKELDDRSRLGRIYTYGANATIISELQAMKTAYNEVFFTSSNISSESIALCKAAGIPYETWTIDSIPDILALDPYITGVTSNVLNASNILLDYYGL